MQEIGFRSALGTSDAPILVPPSAATPFPVELRGGGAAGNPSPSVQTVQGVSNGTAVGTAERIFSASATIVRPANTTAYAANDEVSDGASPGSIDLSDVNDAPVAITAGTITTTDTGPATAVASIEVWIYNTNVSVGADNAAFSSTTGGFVGKLVGTFEPASDGSLAELQPVGRPSLMTAPVAGGRNVKFRLKTRTAFTPSASSTTFTVRLEGLQGRA